MKIIVSFIKKYRYNKLVREVKKMQVFFILFCSICGLLLLYVSLQLLIFQYTAPIAKAKKGTIRIACVGDSITYGTFVKKRKYNCYPARLEVLLNKKKFSVRNFGINGHTMKKETDHPYWKHKNFKRSSFFLPDYVILMLGTNDTKKQNWTNVADYKKDAVALINHYQNLPSKPRVFIITPPKEHIVPKKKEEAYRMCNDHILEEIVALTEISKELNLSLFDFYHLSEKHPEWYAFDGIHLNEIGALYLASFIYQNIKNELH